MDCLSLKNYVFNESEPKWAETTTFLSVEVFGGVPRALQIPTITRPRTSTTLGPKILISTTLRIDNFISQEVRTFTGMEARAGLGFISKQHSDFMRFMQFRFVTH